MHESLTKYHHIGKVERDKKLIGDEKMETETWVNEAVKIDFQVPKCLQNLIDECEQANVEHNGAYFNLIEDIDILCKNLNADGKISNKQWAVIAERYTDPN